MNTDRKPGEPNAARALRKHLERAASNVPGVTLEMQGLHEGADVDGIDRIDAALGNRKILRVLNRNGYFVLPIDDGRWIVTAGPWSVLGVRHVLLSLRLRDDVKVADPGFPKVVAWLIGANAAEGPKVAYLRSEQRLMLYQELPESGLSPDSILAGITVMGRLASLLHEDLEQFGAGHAPPTFWELFEWSPMDGVFSTAP